MTIHEIEKRSFEELKAERDALTEAARGETVDVLAARYIKALMDAKHRDEKLADQGKVIAALQDGMEAAKAQAQASRTETQSQAQAARAETQALQGELSKARAALDADEATIGTLTDSLAKETARADRLKATATRHHQAIARAAALLNEALGTQAVDAADAGGIA